MKKHFDVLKGCMLFNDINEDELDKMLTCLDAKTKEYEKGSIIILAEENVSSVGIILFGSVQIIKEDYLGNKNILAELSSAEVFSEAFVCAGVQKSPVTVSSVTECEILFIDYNKIIASCSSVCSFHSRLIKNMLRLIANKNLVLNQKIEFISNRSTREKLLSYLWAQADKAQSKSFVSPFSRTEMADFLCVDRSAMSRELCRLRDKGVLRFKGNVFELL